MTKIGPLRRALLTLKQVMAAFTKDEEQWFREGDSADSVPTEIIDLPSYHPRGVERQVELTDDYASYAVTIEADEMSGLLEAA